jgi:hypothetical protein
MKLTIKVTQEHIDRGHKADCYVCPFALAACEAIRDTPYMFVMAASTFLRLQCNPSKQMSYDISIEWPMQAQRWIIGYDAGDLMYPITVEIDTDDGIMLDDMYERRLRV